jgi:hypothetical protein
MILQGPVGRVNGEARPQGARRPSRADRGTGFVVSGGLAGYRDVDDVAAQIGHEDSQAAAGLLLVLVDNPAGDLEGQREGRQVGIN